MSELMSGEPGAAAFGPGPVTQNWHEALEALRGAYADTTINGYARDFGLFTAWCAENDCSPLPASSETLAHYLDTHIASLRASTLVRRLAAVVRVHRMFELDNPAESERVRLARRRIQRFRPNRPHQAHGIDRVLREQMLSTCPETLAGRRDRVLVALGFEGLCRRSEIAALVVDDVVHNRAGQLALLIRRSKADQSGDGRIITLSDETGRAVMDWLKASRIETGPLTRPVYEQTTIARHLAGYSISRLLKTIATRAGLPAYLVDEISGHSLRVGAAQTLLEDAHDVLRLMKAGGWKSASTVMRYVDRSEVNVWI